jgi:hypothetical protein
MHRVAQINADEKVINYNYHEAIQNSLKRKNVV